MSRRPSLDEAARSIVQTLRAAGHEALWAGGCVRDMLRDSPPADIDIATSATPDEIMARFPNTRQVGVQFGVVLVKQWGHWIEVATFRRDVDYQDGRRPEKVEFTTAREDALRRDFTINGLFYDPLANQVIDYVGGREDLKAKRIRAIGTPAERFAEDHLRMLRAARFAARLSFDIDETTAAAIREHGASLNRISPERIREELEKMLTHPTRARAVVLLGELGLLPHLWPRGPGAAGRGTPRLSNQAAPCSTTGGDAGESWPARRVELAANVLAHLPPNTDFIPALAAFLHDLSPQPLAAVAVALRCSNQEVELAIWLAKHRPDIARAHELPPAPLRRLRAHPAFDSLLDLHRAAALALGTPLAGWQAAFDLGRRMARADATPPPYITGEDLIRLGLRPGPPFKRILEELYDAQLNDELADRPAAIERLRLVASRAHVGS